ncbi:hypothetical protein BDV59DRAFT_189408, partial [Aspergillus ambiguus]|uniref:uncharacterized protein n=1 Tax=Aspergillus ambiguus TaxID=176160 RepID=UPI003CCD5B3E
MFKKFLIEAELEVIGGYRGRGYDETIQSWVRKLRPHRYRELIREMMLVLNFYRN